jgi:hypothetical protein
MTIGVAIPTYIKHIDKLKGLLDNIQSSTIKPSKVSVSCSSYVGDPIKYGDYDFELIVNYYSEYKNPSSNRNSAARLLDTDIISFMDGDDMVHPQRNEFIIESFSLNKCSALLHNYKLSSSIDTDFFNKRYDKVDYLHEYVNTPGVNNYPDLISYPYNNINHLPYQNAHISILKNVFDRYQYDENELLKYKEDSEYTNRLVKNNIKISYIHNPLSIYIK